VTFDGQIRNDLHFIPMRNYVIEMRIGYYHWSLRQVRDLATHAAWT
jgi:hypothetical protein